MSTFAIASKWLGSRGVGSALPKLLARESTGGLREETRTEGGKDVASGLEGWTPKIMRDRRLRGLLY